MSRTENIFDYLPMANTWVDYLPIANTWGGRTPRDFPLYCWIVSFEYSLDIAW